MGRLIVTPISVVTIESEEGLGQLNWDPIGQLRLLFFFFFFLSQTLLKMVYVTKQYY